jgi:tRNA(fMet)-specific endonuclease VapC
MTILDTDIFTHLTYGHENVVRHYEAVPEAEEIAVTAITRTEVLRGRMDNLLKAADERELLLAAERFRTAEDALAKFLLLYVDEEAARHFATLRAQKKLNKMSTETNGMCKIGKLSFVTGAELPKKYLIA